MLKVIPIGGLNEIGKNLTIHCYQPEANFCACVLIPDEQT